MAPDELASAPHSTAVRGGAVGGASVASSEPPGLRQPEASHPPAGRPEPRATSPVLPIARAGGKRPALREGSPAPVMLWYAAHTVNSVQPLILLLLTVLPCSQCSSRYLLPDMQI